MHTMDSVLLSRFEVARLIGLRALQISEGDQVKVAVPSGRLRENSLYLAALELKHGALDAKIDRGGELVDVSTARLPDSLEIILKNYEA